MVVVGVVNVPHALAHAPRHVEDVVEVVTDVAMRALDAMGAMDHARVVMGALDAEDLVLVHVQQEVKVRHAQHAIVARGVLAHAHHVHHVEDVVVVAVADQLVPHAMVDVLETVNRHVVVVVGVRPAVNRHVQLDVKIVLDVLEVVLDVLDVVLDVTAHVLAVVMGVVMGVAVNVKTHVLLTAQQRVQVPAKLKHLVP